MRRLQYLAVLLLVPLLILAPSAKAQDNSPTSIILSGNGRTMTDSFNLGSGLVIVTVCGGNTSANTSEPTDSGLEAGDGEVVARAGGAIARISGVGTEARAGGTQARVSEAGAVARAGGAIARSGSESTTSSQQVVSSKQTINRSNTNCAVRMNTNQRGTNQQDIIQVDTNQGNANQEDTIHLLDENGTQVGGNLTSETGSSEISQTVQTKAGQHALDVQADGPWTIKLEQPRPSSAPQTTRFSGEHTTATDFFWLSRGPKSFEMTHQGDGKFAVRLLDRNGAKVGKSLVNGKGSFKGSKSVLVPRDGVYLLQVEADGPWTVRAQ